MMRKICIHDKNKVSSRMLYAMEVSSSFTKYPEVVIDVTTVSTENELHFQTYQAPILMVLVVEPVPQIQKH